MEYDKINNLLLSEDNESEVSKANRANEMSEQLSKFVTRQFVNSLSNTYNENKSIRFKTPMLRSNLCDYSDAYIFIKGTVTVNGVLNEAENEILGRNTPLILQNNAPFVSCMTKINNEFIEDADDLDIVIPMYNLLEYSKNYRKTIGSLYNYYRDELSDDNNPNSFPNTNVVNSNAFEYKNKITGNTNNQGTKDVELAIPLKYLGNFWRALNIPLVSCEIFLELKWNKNCIITSLEQRQVDAGPAAVNGTTTGATLAINDCKLYVPVVTVSKDDEIKLLTNLKSGFKREIIRNKYRSQMTTEVQSHKFCCHS